MKNQLPKERKTKKSKKLIWTVCGVLLLLILAAILFWYLHDNKRQDDNGNNESTEESGAEQVSTPVEESGEENIETIKITTPYCDLEYPAQWEDYLKYEENAEEDTFSETFYCNIGGQQIKLYTIYLGETGKGDFLGQLEENGKEIKVYVEMFDLTLDDMKEEEKTVVYAMAEAVNDMIQALENRKEFTSAGTVSELPYEQIGEPVEIATPYCVLKYPSQWEEYLSYEEQDNNGVYSVVFYCNIEDKKVELFTTYFGNSEVGDLFGYITKDGTKSAFSIKAADLTSEDSWTEEETRVIYAMGECINDVAESVSESQYFTFE